LIWVIVGIFRLTCVAEMRRNMSRYSIVQHCRWFSIPRRRLVAARCIVRNCSCSHPDLLSINRETRLDSRRWPL